MLKTGLVISGDADGAKQALLETDAALAATEKEAAALKAAYDKTNSSIADLAKTQARATAEIAESRAALNSGAIGLEQYNREVLETRTALALVQAEYRTSATELRKANTAYDDAANRMDKVTSASGAQRAGLQQLGMQLGDMSTMYAMGAKPMQIFASQSGQVLGALQLVAGEGGKLAGFLGGPWGIAVMIGAQVLVPLIGYLFDSGNAADTASGQLDGYTDALKRLHDEQANSADIATVQKQINALRDERLKIDTDVAGRAGLQRRNRYAALTAEINGLEQSIKWQNAVTESRDRSTASTNRSTGAVQRRTAVSKPHVAAISDEQRAYEAAVKASDQYIESLEDEIARIGKAPKELRLMADARAIDAAKTDEQREAIKRLSAQREFDLGIEELSANAKTAQDWQKNRLDPITQEIALLGLVGAERDRAALALEEEAFKAEALANKVGDAEAAWKEYETQQLRLIEGRSYIEEQLEQARQLEQQVGAIIGTMSRMGGLGGLLGDVGGVLTSGNPIASLLGMGGIGSLLGIGLGGQEPWDKMAKDFETTLRGTFGINGWFADALGENLGSIMQGAQIGGAIGSLTANSKNEMFGSQVGGILGDVAGKAIGKALGSSLGSLGSAMGPLGAIAGSLLGGVLGGLLNSNRTANAVLTNGSDFSVGGKDKGNYGAANDLGSAVLDGLTKIADSFDTSLGNFLVTIGMRGDQIRVNTGGTSLKFDQGATGFGQDAEGAVLYAIADAIKDGAMELPAYVQKLLADGDLEEQLNKALTLKSVMDESARAADPQAYELATLEKWRTDMVAIAVEAGEGMAAVEEAYGRRRADIIAKYGEDTLRRDREIREKQIELLVAQGKVAEAKVAAEALQLEGMAEYLQELQKEINAANDATAAAAELAKAQEEQAAAAAAAAEELKQAAQRITQSVHDIRLQILDLTDTELALKIRREDQLRAASELERVELLRLFATQDQISASEAAARAAQELAEQQASLAAEQQRIASERDGLLEQWYQLTGQTDKWQAAQLAKLDPSNWDVQQDLWDYQATLEETAKAAEEAADAERDRAQAIADARGLVDQAYQRERGALQELVDGHRDAANDLREYASNVFAVGDTAAGAAEIQNRYRNTAAMLRLGDEKSASAFSGDANAYLEVVRQRAGSMQEYQTAQAEVARDAMSGAKTFDSLANTAERQIAAMDKEVELLIGLDEKQVGLREAIDRLNELTASSIAPPITAAIDTGMQAVASAVQQVATSQTDAAADTKAIGVASVATMQQLFRLLDGAIRNGRLVVMADDALPVSATIVNTEENPVPTLEVTP